MRTWWEEWPERFEYELDALRSGGFNPTVKSKDVRSGVLEVELVAQISGTQQKLQAKYSPFFPYGRIEVFAPTLALKRHQHPFSKNLCLLSRASTAWEVDDTLEKLIREQLPKLIAAAEEPAVAQAATLEEQQGEPTSSYLGYPPDSILLVDGSWVIPHALKEGLMVLGLESVSRQTVRGAILELRDNQGQTVARCAEAIRARFSDKNVVRSRWFRIDAQLLGQNPKNTLAELGRVVPEAAKFEYRRLGEYPSEVIGLTFPEEVEYRKNGDGWTFILRSQVDVKGWRRGKNWEAYYQRPGRAGPGDMLLRSPELQSLRDCTVAVVGLGCVGMPSALEFVRAGVGRMRVMDDDVVEPATTMRWPFGLTAAGRQKADVLLEFVRQNYPYTVVQKIVGRLGGVPGLGGVDLEDADKFLSGVDLVYDATAEEGIHYLLSQLCRSRNIPYVAASATHGGWGGRVVRLLPNRTAGCWACLVHLREDGTIPEPPSDPDGEIRPPGCTDPTFTGTGFDLLNVPLLGVRAAIGALAAGKPNGYPDIGVEVAILRLRDQNGFPVLPAWQSYNLTRHPKCTNH